MKLKLLLSFFHISRRNLELWRVQLETILEVALRDSEPWVSMLAELMKTFPGSGGYFFYYRARGKSGSGVTIGLFVNFSEMADISRCIFVN